MKYLIIIGSLVILYLSGCATAPQSPAVDSIIQCPWCQRPVKLAPGFFDDTDNYYTVEEFDEMMRELQEKRMHEYEEYLKRQSGS
jgi:hypothetical protein